MEREAYNTGLKRHTIKTVVTVCLFFIGLSFTYGQYRIVSYNVENFFDYQHDTLKNDSDFLAEGKYRWTYKRFSNKAEQIARVICQAGEWDVPLLVGLCEVENDMCMKQLRRSMTNYPYGYIHQESPDERGIDVALMYDSLRFQILDRSAMRVDLGDDYTRDILYVRGCTREKDTLHVMVCHLPSMRGGKQASEWKRQRAKEVIQNKTDSILSQRTDALIVVMGDMNSEAKNDLRGLKNLMVGMETNNTIRGTHKWRGEWSYLDQFYVSLAMYARCDARVYSADFLTEDDEKYLGKRPKRTWQGYRYDSEGYSDHLPIILDFK